MNDERQDGEMEGRGDEEIRRAAALSLLPVAPSPLLPVTTFTLHPSYFIPAYGCPMPKPKLSPPPPPPKPPGPRPPPPPARRDIIVTSGSVLPSSCTAGARVGSGPS